MNNEDLLKKRIIFISGEINDELANDVVTKLLLLDSENHKEIKMYINSPGGSVSSGMAIYDTMNYVKSDVSTICIGRAASMAAVLLSSGTKGKRYILPNAYVMIHQPLGGAYGQATEIKIASKRIDDTKYMINKILANNTGKSLKKVENDTDRDNYMSSKESFEYGIIDKIIKSN